jgi:NAD(P)-dependent dehydrogenase (short-subunit alcohol dehydrogenase family)
LATFTTNVFGTLNVSKAFIPYLRSAPHHRTICNFGSIASWSGGAGFALYAGTKWAVSGISESMRAELAPFGIHVTVVEPGYFRTGILNAGAQVKSKKVMEVYEKGAVGEVRKGLDEMSGTQRGDVVKGCKVLADILCMEGVAEGREVPMRVALGGDSAGVIRGKCEETVGLLKEWEGITSRTDHE